MVNVKDFDIKVPEGDMLATIFNHQRGLMDKYHKIEMDNTGDNLAVCTVSLESCPLNLQDRTAQLQLKSFAWRITEELTEATLAMDENDDTHYEEELIDALHFSVELVIMSGLSEADFGTREHDAFETLFHSHISAPKTDTESLRGKTYFVIEMLGSAMNRLKLKPWKTTAMLTDEKAYRADIHAFFQFLVGLLKQSDFTARSATAMYLNKNAVNQFRIRSNY